jgi:hypothetical protein
MDISSASEAAPATPPPSFTIYGDQSEMLGDQEFALGDTVTAQLRVKSVADGQDGRSVGFELVSLAPAGPAIPGLEGPGELPEEDTPTDEGPSASEMGMEEGEVDEESDPEEEAVLGYKRPKVKRQAPKLSAKDLQE